MALSRGKATIVAPTTNACAGAHDRGVARRVSHPTHAYGAVGILLALVGSTLMVYSDEKRGAAPTPTQRPSKAPS